MRLLRTSAVTVVAVLVVETVMSALEKASPLAEKVAAPLFALLFVALGFAVRRFAPTIPSLVAVLAGAIAYVTLGYWVAGYVGNGTTTWHWLGPPMTIAIATMYFFIVMAIGVGAASLWKTR